MRIDFERLESLLAGRRLEEARAGHLAQVAYTGQSERAARKAGENPAWIAELAAMGQEQADAAAEAARELAELEHRIREEVSRIEKMTGYSVSEHLALARYLDEHGRDGTPQAQRAVLLLASSPAESMALCAYLENKGRYADALAAARDGWLRFQDRNLRGRWADLLARTGAQKELIDLLRDDLAAAPNDLALMERLAMLLLAEARWQEAVEMMMRALAHPAGATRLLAGFMAALVQAGQTPRAVQLASHYLREHAREEGHAPGRRMAIRRELAEGLRRNHTLEAAVSFLDAQVAEAPDDRDLAGYRTNFLVNAVRSEDRPLRLAALALLRVRRDAAVEAQLAQVFAETRGDELRLSMVEALVEIQGPEALPFLESALACPARRVRLATAQAIAAVGCPAALAAAASSASGAGRTDTASGASTASGAGTASTAGTPSGTSGTSGAGVASPAPAASPTGVGGGAGLTTAANALSAARAAEPDVATNPTHAAGAPRAEGIPSAAGGTAGTMSGAGVTDPGGAAGGSTGDGMASPARPARAAATQALATRPAALAARRALLARLEEEEDDGVRQALVEALHAVDPQPRRAWERLGGRRPWADGEPVAPPLPTAGQIQRRNVLLGLALAAVVLVGLAFAPLEPSPRTMVVEKGGQVIALAKGELARRRATATPVPTPTATPTRVVSDSERASGRVSEVLDGSTIRLQVAGQMATVRYLGIDVPAPGQPGSKAVLDANRSLVIGRIMFLEQGSGANTDSSGRWLRHVWLPEGQLASERLLEMGLAAPAIDPLDPRYQQRLADAAKKAWQNQAGFWHGGTDLFPMAAVKSDEANIREAPGTDQAVRLQVTKGAVLAVSGCNAKQDWIAVRMPGSTTGWMSAGVVELTVPVTGLQVIQQ